METKKIFIYIGLSIVIITHIAMIVNVIPMSTMLDKKTHAVVNLIAAGLIIYGIN
jgi:hypothetical protein